MSPDQTVPPEILLDQLQWRYATKKFDPTKKISASDWQTLERALVLSPSSYGLQPYRFFVIDDPAVRQKLSAASWGQRQPIDASRFVVFARKLTITEEDVARYVDLISEVRGVAPETLAKYRDAIVGDVVKGPRASWSGEWAARQAYIALGNFLSAAAMLGIDACPMEGFAPLQYDEILGLTAKGYGAVVVAAAGYRAADCYNAKLPKVRFPQEELIQHI
jgi:nitroreductase